jgi:hypothetical protein
MNKPFDDIFKIDEAQIAVTRTSSSNESAANDFEEIKIEETTTSENQNPQFVIVKTHLNENSQSIQV